jgi:hypothetical protein
LNPHHQSLLFSLCLSLGSLAKGPIFLSFPIVGASYLNSYAHLLFFEPARPWAAWFSIFDHGSWAVNKYLSILLSILSEPDYIDTTLTQSSPPLAPSSVPLSFHIWVFASDGTIIYFAKGISAFEEHTACS